MKGNTNDAAGKKVGRRTFLSTSAGAAAGFTVVRARAVAGTKANSKIEVGLVGCGNRGKWIAPLFIEHGGFAVTACADYYPYKVDEFAGRTHVDASRRFTGLSGYEKVIASGVDAVVIETPPYFHPSQAGAAVDAGKHVYLAKPIAVDVPGCLRIERDGKRATEKKLVYFVDFQTRNNELYREAVRRVHAGDIGRLVCADARYPWKGGNFSKPKNEDDKLRRWYCYRALSGDHIVEQSIHAIDVATWLLDAHPEMAEGMGGTKNLRNYGDIWDHFAVLYRFPENVLLSFHSVQVIPGVKDEIPCRVYGSDGVVDTDYMGDVGIRGKKPYEGGRLKNLYTSGTVNNIRDFHTNITEGRYDNATVPPAVRSNLTAILGRNAAYQGTPITWNELMGDQTRYEPDLTNFRRS